MTRFHHSLRGLLAVMSAAALIACNKNAPEEQVEPIEAQQLTSTANLPSTEEVTTDTDTVDGSDAQVPTAVIGASEIPYPVYPNGTKYRVGGENGLKIVLFQTEDTFEKVDEFYHQISDDSGMPRLLAMSDYVRYAKGDTDDDPWGTDRPGIVIHEFTSEDERKAVGASATAITNIIMSF